MNRVVQSSGRNLVALCGGRAARLGGISLGMMAFASPAFAQAGPIGQLQTAATGAATDASGLVVAVLVITLAVIFGIWAIKKARSG